MYPCVEYSETRSVCSMGVDKPLVKSLKIIRTTRTSAHCDPFSVSTTGLVWKVSWRSEAVVCVHVLRR